MSEGDKVVLSWSHSCESATASALQNANLHGAPVQDFLQHFPVAGLSLPSSHPSMQTGDGCSVNDFSHYPMFEEIHMVVNEEVPEHYFVMSSLSTSNSSEGSDKKAPIFSPELVDVKFKPSDLPHLSDAQLDTLKKLCLEFADVFSVDNEVGEFPPELLPKFKIVLKGGCKAKAAEAIPPQQACRRVASRPDFSVSPAWCCKEV